MLFIDETNLKNIICYNELIHFGGYKMRKISFVFMILFLSLSLFSCEDEKINISFDSNGGSPVNDITYKNGEIIRLPENPIKEGYSFDGWYLDNESIQEFNVSMLLEENVVLYAKWSINQYTLSFDTDDGSYIAPITQDYNSKIIMPDDPVKEGHSFLGWDQEIPEKMPLEGLKLTAKWSVNQYTISFDTVGGSEIPSVKVYYGELIDNFSIPTKEGHNFIGWGVEEPFTVPATDVTLIAKWEIKTFDLNIISLQPISNLVNFSKSVTGNTHTLGITTEGEVYVWGSNWTGQLGDGTYDIRSTPINITSYFDLENDDEIIDVAAGYLFSMALSLKGKIFTWGSNYHSQLGRDYGPFNQPIEITDLFNLNENEKIILITTQSMVAIAITDKGRIFTWGSGQHPNSLDSNENKPTDMTHLFNLNEGEFIHKVSAFYTHVILLTSNNRLYTWGYNSKGQLGNGSISSWSGPVDISSRFQLQKDEKFTDISSGYEYSMTITSLGEVYAWGDGFGSTPQNITNRFYLLNNEKILSVLGGTGDALFISSEEKIYTLSNTGIAELNYNDKSNAYFAIDITDLFNLSPEEKIENMSRSNQNINLITSAGKLYIHGENNFGQIGNGFRVTLSSPINIINTLNLDEEETIEIFSSNAGHSLLLTTYGNLISWGNNENGQLGIDLYVKNSKPINIITNFNFMTNEEILQIETGRSHSILLTTNGRVFTWGENNYGQLGDGTTHSSFLPVDITLKFNLTNNDQILKVIAGNSNNYAITQQGKIYIWGFNQKADEIQTTYLEPFDITSIFSLWPNETIEDIIPGNHSFVLTSENRIFAWGNDYYGQLGDGSNINTDIPIDITKNFNFSESEHIISLKSNIGNSMAITNNGRIFTWGNYLLIGKSESTNSNIPVDVTTQFTLRTDERIVGIDMGSDFSVAFTSENRIFVWGYNSTDALSYLSPLFSLKPLEISSLFNFETDENIQYIESGSASWFLVTTKNNIYGIGHNSELQLGIESSYFFNEPQYWDESFIEKVNYGEKIAYPIFEKEVIAWFLDSNYKYLYKEDIMMEDLTLYPLFA